MDKPVEMCIKCTIKKHKPRLLGSFLKKKEYIITSSIHNLKFLQGSKKEISFLTICVSMFIWGCLGFDAGTEA